jgi:hypothetical protein
VIEIFECSVDLDTLSNSPFSLVVGDSIQAEITAVNEYGNSAIAGAGSGALFSTVPETPTSFGKKTSSETTTTVEL